MCVCVSLPLLELGYGSAGLVAFFLCITFCQKRSLNLKGATEAGAAATVATGWMAPSVVIVNQVINCSNSDLFSLPYGNTL